MLKAATSFGIPCLIFEILGSKIPSGVNTNIDATFTTTKNICFGSLHTQK
ncbi:hypothetical protein SPYJRS4_1336 [Streptococcus pyogenes JRS4]|nr:hypothetical protein SPYJRS4_1336 [Streptococcus pyogenes JRS4]